MRRWELRGPAVRALAAVAIVVAVGAGVLAWRARPEARPVAPAPSASEVQPRPSTGGPVVVAVSGAVARPGLVRLPPGARAAGAVLTLTAVSPQAAIETTYRLD